MKVIKEFIIGSRAFFLGIDEYNPKDKDILAIVDCGIKNNVGINFRDKDKDIFLYENRGKKDFIDSTIKSGVNMKAGKFLVPEFAKYLNLTIEDLKKLEKCFYEIDEKHKYERLIYDYYIANNDFYLTKEQLSNVYQCYKEKREV